MKKHIIILLIIICYVSGNMGKVFLNPPIQLFPFVIMGYCAFILLFYKRTWVKSDLYASMIIGGAFLWYAFRFIWGPKGETVAMLSLSLPAFITLILPTKQDSAKQYFKTKNIIATFLLYFFLLECGIAIIEFIMRQHIFGWIGSYYSKGLVSYGENSFRSVAFLNGGPVNNALVVTTLNLFYLLSDTFSLKKKTALFILGLAAVCCFNARMAIVINILGLLLFIGKEIWYGRQINRMQYVVFLLVVIIAFCSFFITYNMGNRLWLFKDISADGSIQTRLRLFKYIFNVPLTDLLWGHSLSWINHNMNIFIKVVIIENYWIMYIYHLGIIVMIYFTVCYLKLCQRLYLGYSKFSIIVTSLLFIILASANDSLYATYLPLTIFLLCIYVYKPISFPNSSAITRGMTHR